MLFKYSLLAFIGLVGSVSCFPESRIVNGTATDITEHPFVVSLRGPGGFHECGGSIISSRWIMTAAHCVDGRSPSQMTVQYATTKISNNGTNVVNVTQIIIHEGYDPDKSYANDIALMKLGESLTYNYKTIAPVTLPDSFFEVPQTKEGAPGVLVGWGINHTNGYLQTNLQRVDLKVYSDAECRSRHNGTTTVDQICGGVDEGGKGQCNGDSGGPLFQNFSVQLGIVSWSVKPCAVAPYPGVNTKVSHYIDWIRNNMN